MHKISQAYIVLVYGKTFITYFFKKSSYASSNDFIEHIEN